MEQNQYEIIVLDLDGTLTNRDKVITPRTKKALMEAQARGKKVVLASGRPTQGVVPLARELELEAHGGVLGEVEYAADVTVHALLPEERAEAFSARLTELAAGGVAAQVCGESFQAVPRTQV